MQSINITVINPWFMVAFFGTGAACIFLAVSSLFKWQQPGAAYLLVGSLLYLIGTVLVTIVFNVPLNDALAIALPEIIEAHRVVGNEYYILKVVLPSMQHLEAVMEKFLQLGAVDISIVLSTPVADKSIQKS